MAARSVHATVVVPTPNVEVVGFDIAERWSYLVPIPFRDVPDYPDDEAGLVPFSGGPVAVPDKFVAVIDRATTNSSIQSRPG